jgi:hypothetical protein
MAAGASSDPAAPARGGDGRKATSPLAFPAKPIAAAPMMTSANGTAKKKMPTKASAASATILRFLSARLPTLTTASSTTASTAAFSPKNSACTMATSPNAA